MQKISIWLAIIVLQSHVVTSFNYCKLKCPPFDPPFGTVLLPGPSKSHFYKCNFGVGVLFKCNHRNHFNPRKKVCDRPRRAHAVVCHGSPDYEDEGSGDDSFNMRSERLGRLYDTVRKTRDDHSKVSLKDNKQKRTRMQIFNRRTHFCSKRGKRHFHPSIQKYC